VQLTCISEELQIIELLELILDEVYLACIYQQKQTLTSEGRTKAENQFLAAEEQNFIDTVPLILRVFSYDGAA
jgi:hypothetical protein